MRINVSKSAVLVREGKGKRRKETVLPWHFEYEVDEEYPYLGVEMSANGKLDGYIERMSRKIDGYRWKLNKFMTFGG